MTVLKATGVAVLALLGVFSTKAKLHAQAETPNNATEVLNARTASEVVSENHQQADFLCAYRPGPQYPPGINTTIQSENINGTSGPNAVVTCQPNNMPQVQVFTMYFYWQKPGYICQPNGADPAPACRPE